MKIISLNLEFNKHLDLILPFLKREMPDIVCLQEMLEEDISKFKELLGYEAFFKPSSTITFPAYAEQKGKVEGVAIMAKRIERVDSFYYCGDENNARTFFEEYDPTNKSSVVVWIETKDIHGNIFRVATSHLPITEKGASTPYQLQATQTMLDYLLPFGELIFCADTNAPRGNETFALINSKYKDNIPAEYKTSLDQHLHRVPGLQFMVDGLFTTDSYVASDVKLVDGISDHMAIVATIETK